MIKRPRAVIAALSLCVVVGALSWPKGSPRIVIENRTHDWGMVIQGDRFEHTFLIRNVGSRPLDIKSIEVPCGCMTPRFDRSVAPGSVGHLKVVIKTDYLLGRQNRSIIISSNDPLNPTAKVELKGDVLPFVNVDPPVLTLEGFPGDTRRGEFLVKCAGELALQAIQLKDVDERLNVKIGERLPGRMYSVAVEDVASNRGGALVRILLDIVTSDGVTRRKELRVRRTMLNPIEISPDTNVVFDASTGRSQNQKSVLLYAAQSGIRFNIRKVTVVDGPPGILETKVQTLEAGQRYRLDVVVRDRPEGIVRANVIIETDPPLGSAKQLRVLVLGSVMSPTAESYPGEVVGLLEKPKG